MAAALGLPGCALGQPGCVHSAAAATCCRDAAPVTFTLPAGSTLVATGLPARPPSGRFGEPWTRESWLQAAGFALLVAGTAVYAQANHFRSTHSAADVMTRLRIRRHQPRLGAGAGPGSEAEGGTAGGDAQA